MKKTTLARLINLFNGKREWNVTKSGNGKRVVTRVYGKRAFSSNAFFLPVFLPQFYFFSSVFHFSDFSLFRFFALFRFRFSVFRFFGFSLFRFFWSSSVFQILSWFFN